MWERFEPLGGAINFEQYPSFVSCVVHGHTDVVSSDSRQIGLDSILGKSLSLGLLANKYYLVFQDVERVLEKSLSEDPSAGTAHKGF